MKTEKIARSARLKLRPGETPEQCAQLGLVHHRHQLLGHLGRVHLRHRALADLVLVDQELEEACERAVALVGGGGRHAAPALVLGALQVAEPLHQVLTRDLRGVGGHALRAQDVAELVDGDAVGGARGRRGVLGLKRVYEHHSVELQQVAADQYACVRAAQRIGRDAIGGSQVRIQIQDRTRHGPP
jgi:hypothetical protein